jgi:Fe-S-cluster containining protein
MPARELRQKYLRRAGFRVTITEDIHTRDCIFLRQGNGFKECMIYPVRPSQCRSWPFWPGNLVNPDGWDTAAKKCPGINRGEVYSSERIQAIKKQ